MKNRNIAFTAILFSLALLCEAAGPKAFGVVPAPDGDYPGGNTAEGQSALFSLTTGTYNTAVGQQALTANSIGNDNTAIGAGALLNNVDGTYNAAIGFQALLSNTTGYDNVAMGHNAGTSQTTGSNNIYIGSNISGVGGESDACYIKSIFAQTSNGVPVLINSDNKLGTTTSSKRFKQDIKPMDKASEALFALKPVTFRYKKELDPARRSQFGLVAEEVEKVNPDLVVHDNEGKIYSVRYDQVNAMLLNEFLKEHRKVEDIKNEFHATVAQQQKEIQVLTAQLKEQATQTQKVSARVDLDRAAPRQAVLKIP